MAKKSKNIPPPRGKQADISIVGIGASAGGIEALKEFFTAMPPDSGLAFVVIQHLEPSHESRMAEILGKYTTMKVVQAEDDISVEPDTVYTNPPGRCLIIQAGRLHLDLPEKRQHVKEAINHFLSSLADDKGERAIAIILSGSSASDGPQGVRAVHAAAGLCIAQDPRTAQYPAMPQGVIDTGLADYVLPVNRMPSALLSHSQKDYGLTAEETSGDLESILSLLRTRVRSDYRHYKKPTVVRRIRRRMALREIGDMDSYLKLLLADADELTQLSKEMLIGVSSFFRDSEAFEALRSEAIVPLVRDRDPDTPLRAWVPGCATGEEAYSVAILLLEACIAAEKPYRVQVFASDVSEEALEAARAGVYPKTIAADISANRLRQFFTEKDGTYRVEKKLREAVIFSRHNLLIDPPFPKLDLISCRNVLIYLEPEAQKKVLSMFSFALNTGGYLLLGKSEGITGVEDLFEPISHHKRLYRSIQNRATRYPLYGRDVQSNMLGWEQPRIPPIAIALAKANQMALLKHFNAASVLADAKGQILQFHGQTEKYLGHPSGLASLNILDMTSGILSAQLRQGIYKAMQQDEPVVIPHVPISRDEALIADVTLMRVPVDTKPGSLLAIIFEDVPQPDRSDSLQVMTRAEEPLVAQLEAEVKALRTELRTSGEEYLTANEELRAANEEIMSMNEELEASKEELQATNEELTTINGQMADRMADLTAINNDLANLLSATEIATVFLDSRLLIKRFTPRATDLLNLIPGDIGRPLNHVTQNFPGGDELAADAEKAFKNLSVAEREVCTHSGHWYTVRVLPYRTLDDRIEGVVVTFSNVTRLKEAEDRLQYQKTYAESIVETVRTPLIVLDAQLRIMSANKAFYQMFQARPEDTVGLKIFDLGYHQWEIGHLQRLLGEIIPKESSFQDFRVEHEFLEIGTKTMLLSGRRVQATGGMPECILLSMVDITELERDRGELKDLNAKLEQRVAERTTLAERRADQLRDLTFQLTQAEQRERKRLAHVLHDDLQQLLVGAKFQVDNLRARTKEEKSDELLDKVTSLLNQSIETSRALTVEMSPPILFELGLSAALPWLARQMETKHGLAVQTDINTEVVPEDEGISILLFSAVRELLFNVIKHAKVTTARIQLNRIDDEHVRIVVSDEGIGFDMASRQSDSSMDTGLGLFGIRERLEHVAGRVEIDSAPGRGTRVTLVAPIRKARKALETVTAFHPLEAGPLRSQAPPDSNGRKIRVLIADDHAIVRQGLAELLKHEKDIEVVSEAADGQQALELSHRFHPDVVVMDLSMPVMDGVEATRRITAELPGTQIIGLSMYVEADRAEALLNAGGKAYLSKGGPSEALIAAIHSVVGTRPPG